MTFHPCTAIMRAVAIAAALTALSAPRADAQQDIFPQAPAEDVCQGELATVKNAIKAVSDAAAEVRADAHDAEMWQQELNDANSQLKSTPPGSGNWNALSAQAEHAWWAMTAAAGKGAASVTGSAAHEFASRPRCAVPAGSGRQLLGVSWDDLHDPGAGFSALDINDRDGISSLVITYTPGARPLLPLGAKCIALDLPFTVHHASKRPLIQSRTIRVPIDHTVPGLPACRRCGGFQISGIA